MIVLEYNSYFLQIIKFFFHLSKSGVESYEKGGKMFYFGWSTDLVYLFRLVFAAICGAFVGLEREKRQKSAGLRTHIIVAMASSLMMIVSKYGFLDVINIDGISLDASRIAAGVVTAIGFLGAGVIFIRKDNAVGLTTAAGLWTTVGIGIAIGAGMYFIGLSTTVLMLIVQLVMHWKKLGIVSSAGGSITVNMTKHNLTVEELREKLEAEGIFIRNMSVARSDANEMILKATVMLSKKEPLTLMVNDINHMDYIDSMDIYTIN